MEFPTTIEGFGYEFNEDGELREKGTGSPFQFEVKKDDHAYNQARYEALGELVTPFVYKLLEERCGLVRRPVPMDVSEGNPQTFIFTSPDFQTAEKVMILIHGTGVVRAGQWSRRLILNDSINSGTQVPFIERAKKEGYGVLVTNTNDVSVVVENKKQFISGSESPERHGTYVWKHYILPSSSKKIAVVAHSYGGAVFSRIIQYFKEDVKTRVFAVAFTDSFCTIPKDCKELLQVCRNWVTSKLPLGEALPGQYTKIECVSAGCTAHEMTSWSSMEEIFKFFEEKLTTPKTQVPTPVEEKGEEEVVQRTSSLPNKMDVDVDIGTEAVPDEDLENSANGSDNKRKKVKTDMSL